MSGFRANPRLAAELGAQAKARAVLVRAAEKAAPKAEALIPGKDKAWMPRKGNRGTVQVEVTPTSVRLVNIDHGGHLQEWGSEQNAPAAPLRRGVQAAGFRLHET
jgi:hypothetical protein